MWLWVEQMLIRVDGPPTAKFQTGNDLKYFSFIKDHVSLSCHSLIQEKGVKPIQTNPGTLATVYLQPGERDNKVKRMEHY